MQVTGSAIIRVDGKELRTTDDSKLNPGGFKRNPKTGSAKVHGYSQEYMPPELECNVYHGAETSLDEINAITSATVMFETDTGKLFILREAFVTEPGTLNAKDGTVPVKMSAVSCEEV